jgi:hypothetical protein
MPGATTGRCEDDGVGLGLQLGDKYGLVGQLDEGLGVPLAGFGHTLRACSNRRWSWRIVGGFTA